MNSQLSTDCNPAHPFFISLLPVILLLLAPSVIFAQSNSTRSLITQKVDVTQLTVLRGNTHPLARPQFDRGAAPLSLPMNRMLLVLKRSGEQEAALQFLLQKQHEMPSPNFHNWLSPEEFGQQFGPSDEDIQTVVSWLEASGFTVARVSSGRTVIEFSGNAAQVQDAFHTSIHEFVVNGKSHWANASDPQIPTALVPVVAGVDSLHNFPRKPASHHAGVFRRTKATGELQSVSPGATLPLGCFLNNTCYVLGPYDFATIYNVSPLWTASPATDGTGQSIAVVGQTNINIQDVRDFRKLFGLPPNDPQIILDGPDPGIIGDEPEADIDVQWSGAVAKGATIKFVVSATTDTTAGVDLSAEYIIDHNTAPILSNSYGECELGLGTAGNLFYNQLWQQASAEGITVLVATGDAGSATCDAGAVAAKFGLSVSGLSSTPYNVAVGGTDFNQLSNPSTFWNATNDAVTQASAKSYIPEFTWNDSCTNTISLLLLPFGASPDAETNCNDPNLQNAGFLAVVGAGGGKSNCTSSNNSLLSSCSGGYSKPTWQAGTGVPNDGKRDIPDVSLFAGNGLNGSFYIICQADATPDNSCNLDGPFLDFQGYGGTSVATPAFAGMMALVNQKTQSRQGNANFVLYKLAAQAGASCPSSGTPAPACIFNDVTSGTIAMPCAKGSLNCNTSNSAVHAFGVLSGFKTTAGYDLATGLGSVNANALVNNWSTVTSTFTPSTIMLTLTPSPVNITHGVAVTVNITVAAKAPATGTPGGLVSLITASGASVGDFTLSNGSVSSSTTLLPGGQNYSVTAHYAGDGTFAASDSTPVSVTVAQEPSSTVATSLTANSKGQPIPFTSGPYGSFVYLRADVSGQSGQGIPSGNVVLKDNNVTVPGGPFALNSEGNTATPNGLFTLAPGSHSVTASYAGDASFAASATTAPANFQINPASTSTALSQTSASIAVGTTIGLSATVSSNSFGNSPTGTLTFFSGTTQVGTPVTVTGGTDPNTGTAQASGGIVTSTLPVGQDSITAKYSGDANYSASISPAGLFSVFIPTNTTLNTSQSTIQQGGSVTFTAQVVSTQNNGPTIGGTMQFSQNNFNFGNPITVTNGQAAITTTSLPPGSYTVRASYSGDTNYAASVGAVDETVNPGPDFTLSINPNPLIVPDPGSSGSATITVTGQNGFNGTINFAPSNCSNLPPESFCSFSSPSITGSGTNTLTIRTTHASFLIPGDRDRRHVWKIAPGTIALAGLLCLGIWLLCVSQKGRRRSTIFALVTFAMLIVFVNCGGGGGGGGPSDPGTPAKQYQNVRVTLTSATTHTLSFTVDVQ